MATGISNDYVVPPSAPSAKPQAPPPPSPSPAAAGSSGPAEPDEVYDPHTRYPNTIVNQESDNKYVRLTMRIPGLKTKRQLNLQKVPVNGRVIETDYKKNKVSMMFVLNEKTSDRTVYQYVSREPFKGTIEEEGSTIKFEDDKIVWNIRKSFKW